MKDKETVLGIGVTSLPSDGIIHALWESIYRGDRGKKVFCANPHSIVLSRSDDEFFCALNSADMCLPDGAGVVMASRMLGGKIGKRFAGPDFFAKFSYYANKNGKNVRYFFIGSSDDTLKRIEEKMGQLYPNIQVAGVYSPPFEDWAEEEDQKIVARINDSKTDILWVGLGAPKQECWIYRNQNKIDVSMIGAVGAAFDFFAGTKKRSPRLFRDLGFEWLPRLLREPRRLWKRSIISMPRFLFLVAIEALGRKKRRKYS